MEEVVGETDYLIIGGGIAGVSCAEMLYTLDNEADITLVTATSFVKSVSSVNQITKLITEFQVEEQNVEDWYKTHNKVKVVTAKLSRLDVENKTVYLDNETRIKYGKVCLCTGAQPKLISDDNPFVIGIRDTASVVRLQEKLSDAKKVVIIGNGGIATELVYELKNICVVWAVKDDAISTVYLDPGASQFLIKEVEKGKEEVGPCKRTKYTVQTSKINSQKEMLGSALGPDWHQALQSEGSASKKKVDIKYNVQIDRILTPQEYQDTQTTQEGAEKYPVYARFTDGSVEGADFIVSATGVTPGGQIFRDVLKVNEEGAIVVDENMQTSVKDVYAAGDVCHAGWDWSKHWMQMRLWTQARQMGMFAAKCMYHHTIKEPLDLDFCFEMFAHVTNFFGQKVILLGLFKGQRLENDYELLVRVTPGKEYVKLVMQNGRMQGAVLIGDTDLEETFENLILNQMDLSVYGEDLLDPNIDIEDYFD